MNKISEKAVWSEIVPSEDEKASQVSLEQQLKTAKMFCYKCDQVIPADSVFCPWCQTELFVTCPQCGNKYSSQYPSCNQCGINRENYLAEQKRREVERIRQEKLEREKQYDLERQQKLLIQKREEKKRLLDELIAIELHPYKRKARRIILLGCGLVLFVTCIVLYVEIFIEWLAWTVGTLLVLAFFSFLFFGVYIYLDIENKERRIINKYDWISLESIRRDLNERKGIKDNTYEEWAKANPEGAKVRERWRKQAECTNKR